jgi:ABC-type polysaccharide/polyol phosphate export permease
MLGVVALFRSVALGTVAPDPLLVVLSVIGATILIVTGGMFFSQTQRTLVDRI